MNAPAFAIGTGRCGTHFLAELLGREPGVAAHHERHPLPDAFQRWCVWNRLAVDPAGFLATKEAGIRSDLESHALSFEASTYLALAAPLLHRAFAARFVLLVRRPDRVVSSLLAKGWYERDLARADVHLPAGYQPAPDRAHHPFGRLAALGEDGPRWSALSRVGKLAYFWRHLNEAALRDFEKLPADAARVVAIERFDFAAYQSLARWLGFETATRAAEFTELAASRPGARGVAISRPAEWSVQERAEFEAEVAPLAARLDLEWRCDRLRDEARAIPMTSRGGPLRRLGARLLGRR